MTAENFSRILRLPSGTEIFLTPRRRAQRGPHPDRAGFCDGYQLKEANNPWKTWPEFAKARRYDSAYAKGREKRLAEDRLENSRVESAFAEDVSAETSLLQW